MKVPSRATTWGVVKQTQGVLYPQHHTQSQVGLGSPRHNSDMARAAPEVSKALGSGPRVPGEVGAEAIYHLKCFSQARPAAERHTAKVC